MLREQPFKQAACAAEDTRLVVGVGFDVDLLRIVLPYAVSDIFSNFATIKIRDLLGATEPASGIV